MAPPAEEFAWLADARRAWADELAKLDDESLTKPGLLPGWTRQHIVVHVAHNAVAIGNLLHWAQTGVETPMYVSPERRDADIDAGAALPAREAIALYEKTDADLQHAIDTTTDLQWRALVRTRQGLEVEAATVIWMRARELWVHLADLATGRGFDSVPDGVLRRTLRNVLSSWRSRDEGLDLVVRPDNGVSFAVDTGNPGHTKVTGSLAAVTAWATGRGSDGVSVAGTGTIPDAPVWL
ncbi:maleylpyruvate isomerase family mycothiol-dependent enzyme [Spelaeicoccus albus]|nr:maleylpyruvate isomerase family mycothiol-dependent enzyme [Spelaeicoccus albus]